MNPISGTNELLRLTKNPALKKLSEHPNAPRVHMPNERQFNALLTYWTSVLKHLDKILSIQKYDADYMPVCEMLEFTDGGNLKITVLTN